MAFVLGVDGNTADGGDGGAANGHHIAKYIEGRNIAGINDFRRPFF